MRTAPARGRRSSTSDCRVRHNPDFITPTRGLTALAIFRRAMVELGGKRGSELTFCQERVRLTELDVDAALRTLSA